jgi:hypothetical protein
MQDFKAARVQYSCNKKICNLREFPQSSVDNCVHTQSF